MQKVLWNFDWKFENLLKNDVRMVNLPFDAMQTEDRLPNMKNGTATGFYPGGKYSYTKLLYGAEEYADKTVLLELEGVYQKSQVFLNGELLGGRIYGYSDYYVDLTGKLNIGEQNEVKVIADNSQTPNSRWYSGSGIYRDVYLHIGEKNHIDADGIKVTTKSISPAVVAVEITATMEQDMKLVTGIYDGETLLASGEGSSLELTVPDAKLWTAETPNLYTVRTSLMLGDSVVDSAETRVGIRTIQVDSKHGFQVNGVETKLRGGCVHHEHGPIGAVSLKAAEVRRCRIMKEAGYNAIRYAHNPAGKAFLDACDEVGIYVFGETFDTWDGTKSAYDYALYFEEEWKKDVTDMVRVAYNHPSVVLYSIGNEIYLKNPETSAQQTAEMVSFLKGLDTTRPLTNSINPLMFLQDPKIPDKAMQNDVVDPYSEEKDDKAQGSLLVNILITVAPFLKKVAGTEKNMLKRDACFAPLDIVGLNYAAQLYEPQMKDFPDRVLVGSETSPAKIAENWAIIKEHPQLIGDFGWTAWDYLGEAGVGIPAYNKKAAFTRPYPAICANCSNIDLTGMIDSQGVYTRIVWGLQKEPYIAVHPVDKAGQKVDCGQWRFTDAVHSWSWNDKDCRVVDIDVYGAGATVELFQDGVSLGRQELKDFKASYKAFYLPSTLVAINYDEQGNEIGRDELKTAGEKTILTVTPEKTVAKADGLDLIYIPVTLTDEEGIAKMLEDRAVTVSVEGAASLVGVCSANPFTTTLFTASSYETFHGRMLAVLRTTQEPGDIRVTFTAEGVDPVEVTLSSVVE